MLKKRKLEIPNDMGVGTMAWGDEKAGFVSDPKYKPKEGEFNPADLQVLLVSMLSSSSFLLFFVFAVPVAGVVLLSPLLLSHLVFVQREYQVSYSVHTQSLVTRPAHTGRTNTAIALAVSWYGKMTMQYFLYTKCYVYRGFFLLFAGTHLVPRQVRRFHTLTLNVGPTHTKYKTARLGISASPSQLVTS